MPRRTDISSILIIGAGQIVIGQSVEFDHSELQEQVPVRGDSGDDA
jgi:hypothetical protein